MTEAVEIVYADADYRLEALGLHNNVSPLVLRSVCQHCGDIVHERVYHEYEAVADDAVKFHGAVDAEITMQHVCLGKC
jgi:hypothetical protein